MSSTLPLRLEPTLQIVHAIHVLSGAATAVITIPAIAAPASMPTISTASAISAQRTVFTAKMRVDALSA